MAEYKYWKTDPNDSLLTDDQIEKLEDIGLLLDWEVNIDIDIDIVQRSRHILRSFAHLLARLLIKQRPLRNICIQTTIAHSSMIVL